MCVHIRVCHLLCVLTECVGKLMQEWRCRVVALAHFSMAGCQSDRSATAFLCQQFHHSRLCVHAYVCARAYLCLCLTQHFAGSCTFEMLHHSYKWVSSFIASFLTCSALASVQLQGFGSRDFCQSLVAWGDILIVWCLFGPLEVIVYVCGFAFSSFLVMCP